MPAAIRACPMARSGADSYSLVAFMASFIALAGAGAVEQPGKRQEGAGVFEGVGGGDRNLYSAAAAVGVSAAASLARASWGRTFCRTT